MDEYHIPVMPKEALSFLAVKKGSWYIDANLGGGGHTNEILAKGGKVLGIDLDPEAILEVAERYRIKVEEVGGRLQAVSENLIIYQSNFSQIKDVAEKFAISSICGIFFDLGVSSHQLEAAGRGFSFNVEAPLDMRMNPKSPVTAADLVNGLHERELAELFWKLGEERFSRPIARKIIEARKTHKISTTNELAQIILSVRRRSKGDRTHPATRVFQALRIAVNDELNSLKSALPQALEISGPRGRIVVISFHSLEDRIVKNFFREESAKKRLRILTPKPITPTEEEIARNPRSRSGKLRVAEKISSLKVHLLP